MNSQSDEAAVQIDQSTVARASDRYAQYYGDVRRHLTGEFGSEVRWLTASLFALNAGGLATIAGRSIFSQFELFAGVSFYLGVAFAFAFVTYSQIKTREFIKIVQCIEECWVLAASTGRINETKITKLEEEKRSIKTSFSSILSAGSFVMFSAGVVLAAIK